MRDKLPLILLIIGSLLLVVAAIAVDVAILAAKSAVVFEVAKAVVA